MFKNILLFIVLKETMTWIIEYSHSMFFLNGFRNWSKTYGVCDILNSLDGRGRQVQYYLKVVTLQAKTPEEFVNFKMALRLHFSLMGKLSDSVFDKSNNFALMLIHCEMLLTGMCLPFHTN